MGWWSTERGLGGDAWADEFDRMMKRLSEIRHTDAGETADSPVAEHQITMGELADLVEFCSRGHIRAEVVHSHDADRPLSELHGYDAETYPNRGQIHCEALSNAR